MAIHLNGTEIARHNLMPHPAPIPCGTLPYSIIVEVPNCPTLSATVTNLVPGRNWLAADVLSKLIDPFFGDILFGCEVTEIQYIPGPLPTNPPATIAIRRAASKAFGLAWTGFGYALESTTNLSSQPPVWMEVPDMSNPYSNTAHEPLRLYRLRK